MLPDERMVEAASDALRRAGTPAPRERAGIALRAGLDALDRDDLIQAVLGILDEVATAGVDGTLDERNAEVDAEAVLRAVGLLP